MEKESQSYLSLTSQSEEGMTQHSEPNIVPPSSSNTNKTGYNPAMILYDIPKRYLCMLCRLVMRKPIQSDCGEMACKECYEERKSITDDVFNTGEKTEFAFPDRAAEREIDKLKCKCINYGIGCQWRGIIKELENHVESCQYKPTQCLYCEETTSNIQQHFSDCKDFKELDTCPYDGCNFKPSTQCCIYSHIKENAFFHMALHEKFIKDIMQEKDELHTQIKILQDKFQDQTCKYDEQIAFSLMLKNLRTQVKKPVESEDNHSKQVFPRVTAELLKDGKKFRELDLEKQLLKHTTYDGKFPWKIDNYTHRRQQAITGEITALHSAPCYTSKSGYKFCARLYLNGDGVGKGTHMSIYFVLMKSEYDHVNAFPFMKRVTFKLISQEDPNKSFGETFKPDKASPSFQEPTRRMNIAAGCPMFISLKDLESGGYIKDDCIFFEISTTD